MPASKKGATNGAHATAGDKRAKGASPTKGDEPPAAKKGKQGEEAVDYSKSVFVPMCADFIHVGHINILEGAAAYGPVVVVLMTDDAMKGYKRAPMMSYAQRERILLGFKWEAGVLPCTGPATYPTIAEEHRCGFFYHGDDWKMGPQAKAREPNAPREPVDGHRKGW